MQSEWEPQLILGAALKLRWPFSVVPLEAKGPGLRCTAAYPHRGNMIFPEAVLLGTGQFLERDFTGALR